MPEDIYNEYDYGGSKLFNRNDYPSRVYFWNDIFQYIKDNDYEAVISDDDGITIRVTVVSDIYKEYTKTVTSVNSTF